MGTYDKALPLHERAWRINEKVQGPLHPTTALSLSNLATLFHDMGFYTKAQPLYERALQIRQKALGLEHLGTAQSLNNLGVLYFHLKDAMTKPCPCMREPCRSGKRPQVPSILILLPASTTWPRSIRAWERLIKPCLI